MSFIVFYSKSGLIPIRHTESTKVRFYTHGAGVRYNRMVRLFRHCTILCASPCTSILKTAKILQTMRKKYSQHEIFVKTLYTKTYLVSRSVISQLQIIAIYILPYKILSLELCGCLKVRPRSCSPWWISEVAAAFELVMVFICQLLARFGHLAGLAVLAGSSSPVWQTADYNPFYNFWNILILLIL